MGVNDPSSAQVELTTVTPHAAVFHVRTPEGVVVDRLDDLEPDTDYTRHGISFRTLAQPPGPLRCRLATVNDVHFGETSAGRLGAAELGPIVRSEPGERPFPVVMNEAARDELLAVPDLAALVVKGDLTNDGTTEEFAAFEACYRVAFGDRLHVVRGNHDSYRGQADYSGDHWIELEGVNVALLDTARPFRAGGALDAEQLDWLDAHAASSTVPVLAMGHHPQWFGPDNGDDGFWLSYADSRALDEVFARQDSIAAYTAGHTHRHLVQRAARGIPSIEVGCVKDFPGVWATYEVYDDAIVQTVHRISSSEALAWSERCRILYSDFGVDYAEYALGTLADRCLVIPVG